MILQELLKQVGVTDDVVTKILDAMKQNKIYTASEENLDVRYGKLKTDHESKLTELQTANGLIAELKKNNGDNTALQEKVTTYETTIADLQNKLKTAQIESAIQLALRDNNVTDADYMTFKLKEKGELELTDDGKIKGIEDKISALKTQYPTYFNVGSDKRKVEEKKLPPDDEAGKGMTKADFLKKPYAERAKFYNENPDAYKAIMGE